jgi:hypothetical protein
MDFVRPCLTMRRAAAPSRRFELKSSFLALDRHSAARWWAGWFRFVMS